MVESRLKSDNYIPRRHYAELEREHKRLVAATESQHKSGGRVGVMGGSGGSEDSSSTASLQLLRHLQQKVNALKDENSRLKMTVSMVTSRLLLNKGLTLLNPVYHQTKSILFFLVFTLAGIVNF